MLYNMLVSDVEVKYKHSQVPPTQVHHLIHFQSGRQLHCRDTIMW
jgi:hypothetical protein